MTDANASAATMDSQIPSKPQSRGRIITIEHWNTRVRRRDIREEVKPSLSAVKKDEPNIPKPDSKNEKE